VSIYVEIKPYDEILALAAPYQSLLIVACRECTNMSVAYDTGCKLASMNFEAGIGCWIPTATQEVTAKIRALLENSGKIVAIQEELPCMLTDQKQSYMSSQRTDVGAIISLACVAGSIGISKTVGDAVPVISGAITSGILQYHIDVTDDALWLNKSKSTLVRFVCPPAESVDLQSYWEYLNRSNPID
jgi:hypothetical protein